MYLGSHLLVNASLYNDLFNITVIDIRPSAPSI